MVDEGAFDSVRNFLQGGQLVFDLVANLSKQPKEFHEAERWNAGQRRRRKWKQTHLIKVGDLLQRDFLLFLNGVTHGPLHPLQQEVKSGRVLQTWNTRS